ncbi:MAG: hypothetical protein HUK08_02105, partial [Bacteroidaceae bacterium]|nr:hypothetical protein [Bacteroidaceae bacterium]
TIRTDAKYFTTLEENDIAKTGRTAHQTNNYIEIGARVFDGDVIDEPNLMNLMKRIFVAIPEETDLSKAEVMQYNNHSDPLIQAYYAQSGSSMAYPMNRFDDALEYIQRVRKQAYTNFYKETATAEEKKAAQEIANTRFEIFLANGTHYPYRTVSGEFSSTRGNTFLIPENVCVYGGISSNDTYLSNLGYNSGDAGSIDISDGTSTITLKNKKTGDILTTREVYDVNKNSILEGWGLLNQSILSGEVVNSDENKKVYHVVTAIAAEKYVGLLPDAVETTSGDWKALNGTTFKEKGRPIILDGLQITGGEAFGYEGSVQSASTYYKGGAICVDGNWMTDKESKLDIHHETSLNSYIDPLSDKRSGFDLAKRSVGYRNIPLIIRNSLITNNLACMGGAVFTNGELEVYASQLSQNTARMNTDKGVDIPLHSETQITHHARGGAIDVSYKARLVNCIFANNSAISTDGGITEINYVDESGAVHTDKTFKVPNGAGGFLAIGEHGTLQMMNCHVVRNLADGYPAIYNYAPNAGYKTLATASLSLNDNSIVNTVFWGNDYTNTNYPDEKFQFLMNPVSQWRYEGNKDASGKFLDTPESLWFCAYEPDTWYTPVSIAFSDLQGDPRRTPYEMGKFIPKQISDYVTTETEADRKNFNIHINADNAASDGPNFISPSTKAGVEGYVPSADWMVSRMNNLVDNGWTFMNQKITKTGTDFKVDFVERDGKKGYGIYYTVAGETNSTSEDGYIEMPTEETTYMAYADDPSRTMLRVSKDPNPSHEQCYIDIGAYEYPHVVLSPVLGSEVDVLWVSSKERQDVGVADGSTWEKATSDLQRAIETLLSSRNDHNKEIRLLDGDYVPRYTMGGNRAFIINTSALDGNSVVPDDVEPAVHTEGFGIRSLTIRGGYSSEIKGQYDIQQYQSLMHMEKKEQLSNNNLDHVFIIEDARQRVKHDNNTTTETVPLGSVIPITIEGVTFSNNVATGAEGASAVWYKEQMKDASTPLGAPDVDKKLTLKNVVFTDCGKSGLPLPVVKIERGGDDALIYNSLWHSNHGNSLDAVKTKVINCTFARNDGKVKLDAASELHNSLLWMNSGNKTATATSQCSAANEIDGALTNYTYNAICGLTITDADNDDRDDVSFNSPLSINNRDVLTGPNFIDPEHGDYGVSSSVRVTSKASITAYMNAVYNPATPYTSETSAKAALEKSITDNQKIFSSDFEGVHNQDFLKCHDLSTYVRLYDGGLERGAFEARTLLNRVMYLIASKSQTDTGLRWASAYGTSQLQDAINAGAVYYSANGKPAYIFARGSNNNSLGDIIMRDGVNLYGSLQIQFNDEAEQTYVEGTGYLDYTDEQVNDYVRKVLDDPDRAMAGSATQRTIIKGVTADAANMTGLLDCVEIANTEVGISKPVITVGEGVKAVVLRNCIIRDNNTAAGVRLAEFHGPSLLYNCLSRDNTGLIYFSNNAYSLNSTLTRRTDTGTTAVEGAAGEGAAGIAHFYNSIDFCGDFINTISHVLRSPFAAYFQSRDTYYNAIMPDVFKENKNLWYQLHELSNNIAKSDMSKGETVTETGALTYSLLAEPLKPFVNYLLDRDLLGNPRSVGWTIKGTETEGYKVDYGCFETWSSNPRDTNTGILFPTRDKQYYNGNYYPHEGSVVYVNPNEILLLDNSVGNGFNSDHPFRPGYLLIRDGGAIYGQGSTIELSYLGVQKNMKNRHHLVSLPFRFLNAMAHPQTGAQSNIYATIGQVEYTKDSATGETTGKRIIALSTDGNRPTHIPSDNFSADPLRIYNYNGEKRSDWKYKYVGEDSPCWEQIGLEDVKSASDTKGIAANKGWLMDFSSNSEKDRFIRFTAYGNSLLDWIYTEGDVNGVKTTPKKVELTQYDDRTSDAGGADFTHEYNMGWNLTGVPYLTTNYRAGRLLDNQDDDYGKYEYSLSAPHLGYALNASGSYEAKRSWEDVEGNAMNLSQGFFMQTATLDKTETLTYAVPRYNWTSTGSKGKSMVSIQQQSRSTADDNIELHPDDESGSLNYSLGNDGVKFMAMNESLAQIYAIGTSSLRISLLSHAPVQMEIPVGLHIPADGSYTFAIPEDSDWEGRTVWLIDRETKQVVNLTHDSYTVNFTEADEVIGRFALKLGDGKPEIEQSVTASNNYRITAKDGKLTVSGLSEGDQVAVFTISGTKVDGAVAESSQWQTQVDANKVYVVVVNSGFAKKITAK